jgi:ABC-2 type transport system permease protein
MLNVLRSSLRAYPTMLRVGLAGAVAYRAEMVVWILTNTMPLVNLALWSAVARSGPIGSYGQKDLVAYFFAALVVRQLTGSWVLWEMSRDIRMGLLSMRLLRPVHPIFAYSAENLSAIPLRAGFVLPVAAIGFGIAGPGHLLADPPMWALVPIALIGAWLITFFSMVAMGALGFFIEQSSSVFELWLAAFFITSGYMFPLDFIRHRAPLLVKVIQGLPFYLMNGFPAELILGKLDRTRALTLLGHQWLYVIAIGALGVMLWNAGLKRYNAYGA